MAVTQDDRTKPTFTRDEWIAMLQILVVWLVILTGLAYGAYRLLA